MPDAVQMSALFHVALDLIPARLWDVRVFEHQVFDLRVFDPALARFEIHFAELPAASWVFGAALKTAFLLSVAHGKIILHEDNAGTNQHSLEFGTGLEKLPVFAVAAKPHHPFHASAVVPTP